ncbi:uncharacterized protein LOC144767498 isoform X1 [Lissotriton helveticus]
MQIKLLVAETFQYCSCLPRARIYFLLMSNQLTAPPPSWKHGHSLAITALITFVKHHGAEDNSNVRSTTAHPNLPHRTEATSTHAIPFSATDAPDEGFPFYPEMHWVIFNKIS